MLGFPNKTTSMLNVGIQNGLKHRCSWVQFPLEVQNNRVMKTHTIEVKEEDWKDSKYRTRKWEERVDIVKWEHDFVKNMYFITIRIK